MKAAYLERQAGPESLVFGDIPQPVPQSGEVLVRVHAAAVTPTEFQWSPTFRALTGEPRPFPIVLGHEFSGVVESIDPGINNVKQGDAVYGINDWFTNGAQAEYCIVPAANLARKPESLGHPHAATVPISALTAWQGLHERTRLGRNERLLIHGAAGGVGVFVVQMARQIGARIIATASSGNLDFVRDLGADEVIDYRATRFEDAVRDVDVVFDCVGGETLTRSWDVLAKDGRLVTIAAQSEGAVEAREKEAFMLVRVDAGQLSDIAAMIDAGKLRTFVEEVFPLNHAPEAYARAQKGGMRGKVVLLPPI